MTYFFTEWWSRVKNNLLWFVIMWPYSYGVHVWTIWGPLFYFSHNIFASSWQKWLKFSNHRMAVVNICAVLYSLGIRKNGSCRTVAGIVDRTAIPVHLKPSFPVVTVYPLLPHLDSVPHVAPQHLSLRLQPPLQPPQLLELPMPLLLNWERRRGRQKKLYNL